PGYDPKAVRAAEIVGHGEAEFGPSRAVRLALGDGSGRLLPTCPGHPVADDAGPVQPIALTRLQSFAAHLGRLSDAGELRRRHEVVNLRRWHPQIFLRLLF